MLVCSSCGARFSTSEPRWRCACGALLMLESPGLFRKEDLGKRTPSLWRYREALGIDRDSAVVSLGEGFTPLVDVKWERRKVVLKLDYLCPSGSYKDRGSSVMISKLNELGVRRIIEDSSGNAGASIAAYSAMVGIRADIYVPATTSAGKIAQIEAYGARLVKVPGSREDTTTAAMDAASEIFYASHNWNPYFLAGMKTAAYEIAEQHHWDPPEVVVTPVGGGGLLVGLHVGFRELQEAGYIQRVPRLIAVQAAACDPVYQSWVAGRTDVLPIQKQPTAAEGISVAKPVRGAAILSAIRQTDGVVTTVMEEQIWDAMEILGAQGIYVEPTAAAAPAALQRLWERGVIGPEDRVLVMLTGSGLKATDKIVEHQALVGVAAD